MDTIKNSSYESGILFSFQISQKIKKINAFIKTFSLRLKRVNEGGRRPVDSRRFNDQSIIVIARLTKLLIDLFSLTFELLILDLRTLSTSVVYSFINPNSSVTGIVFKLKPAWAVT